MSAFIVSEKTMHRAVQTICSKNRYGQNLRTFGELPTAGTKEQKNEIGRRLYTLNIEAVMQRYRDEDTGADSLARSYVFKPLPSSGSVIADMILGVKALECLRYQCSEGDVPESEAYKVLDKAVGDLAEATLAMLPEYEAAPWGD